MDLYAPVGPYDIMLQANRKSQTQKSSLQHQHVGLMLIIWSVAHEIICNGINVDVRNVLCTSNVSKLPLATTDCSQYSKTVTRSVA